MDKLLSCPFCGQYAVVETIGRAWYRVGCGHTKDCYLFGLGNLDYPQCEEELQNLKDEWNSRTTPVIQVLLDEAIKEIDIVHNQLNELVDEVKKEVLETRDNRRLVEALNKAGSPFFYDETCNGGEHGKK